MAEQPVPLVMDNVEQMAAFFGAGRVDPVVQQGEHLYHVGCFGRIFRLLRDLPARQAKLIKGPLRQEPAHHFENLHAMSARHSSEVRTGGGASIRWRQFPRKIARFRSFGQGDRFAKFVGACDPYFAGGILLQIKNEGPAIVVAAAARVPIAVSHRANPVVVLRQAQERGVNRLFFGTNQAHLHLAVAESEHLRPQHGGVGNAHQLELLFSGERAGDDEEPGAIGRPMHMRGLDCPVNLPFLRIETVKIQFRRGRQRLDDIFQRIMVGPAQQIEEQGRDFRVGEELGIDLPLPEGTP